jgi:hypothetical protein
MAAAVAEVSVNRSFSPPRPNKISRFRSIHRKQLSCQIKTGFNLTGRGPNRPNLLGEVLRPRPPRLKSSAISDTVFRAHSRQPVNRPARTSRPFSRLRAAGSLR